METATQGALARPRVRQRMRPYAAAIPWLSGSRSEASQHLAPNRHKHRKCLAKLCGRSRLIAARDWTYCPAPARACVLRCKPMELNQIKRFIKDLEERTEALRRYL